MLGDINENKVGIAAILDEYAEECIARALAIMKNDVFLKLVEAPGFDDFCQKVRADLGDHRTPRLDTRRYDPCC